MIRYTLLALALVGTAGAAYAQAPLDPYGKPYVMSPPQPSPGDYARAPTGPQPMNQQPMDQQPMDQEQAEAPLPSGGGVHPEAFRDEFGFRYDAKGNRIDAHGHLISPHSTTP